MLLVQRICAVVCADDGYILLLHTHKKSDQKKENVAIGVGFYAVCKNSLCTC